MRLYDRDGDPIDPRDVLDRDELAAYYETHPPHIGHQWLMYPDPEED